MRRIAVLYLFVFFWGSSSFGYAADTIYSSFGPGDTYNQYFWASFGSNGFNGTIARQYASFTVPTESSYRLTRIEFALDYYSGTPTGTIYGGIFEDNAGYPTGNLLESFELNGIYGSRGTGSIISVDSMTHPILQTGKKYWVGLWTPGADGYDWLGGIPEDGPIQDRIYSNDAGDVWTAYPYDVAFRVTGYPVSAVVYDFSAPQFSLGQSTPFLGITPNIGSSTFRADFTADTSFYSVVDRGAGFQFPLFGGPCLMSQTFEAQKLTITFNTPVYAVSLNFAAIAAGFELHLTSDVGSTSAVYGGHTVGGTLYFSSATPFTSIQLGPGIFAIDNLTLNVPQEAVALLGGDVVALLDAGALTQDQADGLTGKLATAITTLDSGNTGAASNQLEAFINQVNAFIRAKKLSREEGQALIDAAENIRAKVGS